MERSEVKTRGFGPPDLQHRGKLYRTRHRPSPYAACAFVGGGAVWVNSLLLGEGFHGGDTGGALRGEEAGGEAHDSHYTRGTGEDWEVERLYVE